MASRKEKDTVKDDAFHHHLVTVVNKAIERYR